MFSSDESLVHGCSLYHSWSLCKLSFRRRIAFICHGFRSATFLHKTVSRHLPEGSIQDVTNWTTILKSTILFFCNNFSLQSFWSISYIYFLLTFVHMCGIMLRFFRFWLYFSIRDDAAVSQLQRNWPSYTRRLNWACEMGIGTMCVIRLNSERNVLLS
jgi:hypothetical protein